MIVEVVPLNKNALEEAAEVYALAFNFADLGEFWASQSALNFLMNLYTRQPDLFFIATLAGKVVGGVFGEVVERWNGKNIESAEIFVHPDHWNKGIGKLLMEKILEEAIKKYQIKGFMGMAYGRHSFPLDFYRSLGFRETGWVHVYGDASELLQNLREGH